MRNFEKVVWVLGGGVVVTSAAMFLVAGCTIETVVPPDGGDAQPDTNVPDMGPVEGGDIDAGDPIEAFRRAQAKAICARYATCCAGLDGGVKLDTAACEDDFYKVGFGGSHRPLTDVPKVLANGNIQLDATQVQECLTRLAAMSCPTPTANEWKQATAACFGAIVGKLGGGGTCYDSIECQKGNHCDFDSLDGGKDDAGYGIGKCAGLHPDGGACGRGAYGPPTYSSAECAYKGWGVPSNGGSGAFCNYDLGDDQGFCSPLRAQGDDCFADNECSTGYCDFVSSKCAAVVDLTPACAAYKYVDAGGGG
jgi:hypothetical protein